ncbi:hypothetical protein EDD11_008156 [Mortierella claussenii]|nr:hypothetical protein EDD11_008156 [Mortierella claussenii]
MNDSEELAEKYHKLFQDYTRIKAQHAVLKKAVVKEQTENAAIQAALKEKEQEVRKSLQDLDLLSYHNQRLTKRIENLQTQKSGGSWLMGGANVKKELEKSQMTLEAATIDLQGKIEENEKLHQQLYEINALYPRHVTELQGKIQALEKQNQELQLDVERAGVANEDTITLIRKEKDATEKELSMIRDVLAGQLRDEQHANQSLRDNVQRLEATVERLSKVERELESLQVEHSTLQGELETLKWISSELSQIQKAYSDLERDKAQVEKAHAQLLQQHAGLKQAEENLRRALAQEQEIARSTWEQNRKLEKDLEVARLETADRERGHASRIEQLESELSKVQKEQEQLKQQYEDLKSAEQFAKENDSRTKSDLATELATMKSSLESAENKAKELEGIKETLEKELSETRKALEESRTSLAQKYEKDKATLTKEASESTGAEKEDRNAGSEVKIEPEDAVATEESTEDKEKAPLSKKAKKRKAAAAAAAAAAVAASASTVLSDTNETIQRAEDDKGEEVCNESQKKGNEKAVAEEVAKAEADEKMRQEEKTRNALVDSLRSEISLLKEEIASSQQSSAVKQEELSAAQGALDSIKDEKASLSSSLEMHVELTIQLQQEINDLKSELAQKQKWGVTNGSVAARAAARANDDDSEPLVRTRHKNASDVKKGDQTPQRAATPVPTGAASKDHRSVATEGKDESTQVDKADASDKAVQSERVEQVDESTQANLVEVDPSTITSVAKASDATTSDAKEAKDGKTGRNKDNKSSRRSMNVDDGLSEMPMAIVNTATVNTISSQQSQANREYLIKKHYETKIQNITEQLQLSDGRYVRLHKEFELLKELLMETAQEREKMKSEVEQLQDKNTHLQEELAAAKEDNRAQVETMTNFMKSLDQGR